MLQNLKPILQQAKKHKRGPKAQARPIFVSKKVEIEYTQSLLEIVKFGHDLLKNELHLKQPVADGAFIGDSWWQDILNNLNQIRQKIGDFVASIAEVLAKKMLNKQKKATDEQLRKQIEKITGLDLSIILRDEDIQEAFDQALQANVQLIKSIPQQYMDKVEQVILHGVQAGQSTQQIAAEIAKIGQSTEQRAKLIATDQIAKINSRFSQIRQQNLGITHYIWSTSRDERVRHEHRLRDGQLFAWDNPPSDGHPGIAIRCRCVALPYMDHLFDENAKTPQQIMAQTYTEVIDNEKDFSILDKYFDALLDNSKQLSKKGEILLNRFSDGLTRQDLPYFADEQWGFANTGLRNSIKFAQKNYWDKGLEVPIVWATHHWSINSQFISDDMRERKSLTLKESLKLEFASATQSARHAIEQLFEQPEAKLSSPILVYRGESMRLEQLEEIKHKLENQEKYLITDMSFQSNTIDLNLAMDFAMRGVKKDSARVPVIHYAIIEKDAKVVDITAFHYYTENEMLLDANQQREITAVRLRKDGVYEMFSKIKPSTNKQKQVGDNASSQKSHYYEDYQEPNRENYWGGSAVIVSSGGKGSLKGASDNLKKSLAEEFGF